MDQISDVFPSLLAVVDAISRIEVFATEDVKNGQNLTVVWDEGFTDQISRSHKVLKALEGGTHDFVVPGIQRFLERDNQLWNNWKDFATTMLKHIMDSLPGEEFIWMRGFRESLEEQRKIVVVVKLFDFNFPCDFVALGIVFQSDRKVASFVTLLEFCPLGSSLLESPGNWRFYNLRSEQVLYGSESIDGHSHKDIHQRVFLHSTEVLLTSAFFNLDLVVKAFALMAGCLLVPSRLVCDGKFSGQLSLYS